MLEPKTGVITSGAYITVLVVTETPDTMVSDPAAEDDPGPIPAAEEVVGENRVKSGRPAGAATAGWTGAVAAPPLFTGAGTTPGSRTVKSGAIAPSDSISPNAPIVPSWDNPIVPSCANKGFINSLVPGKIRRLFNGDRSWRETILIFIHGTTLPAAYNVVPSGNPAAARLDSGQGGVLRRLSPEDDGTRPSKTTISSGK
jgi:hypothetical protein